MVRKRGSVLILTALLLAVAVAIAAEVFHLSRAMLDAKVLQRVAEPAALGAVLELDGTPRGIDRAGKRARDLAGREVGIEFARTGAGPWLETPSDPKSVRFVRVTARQTGPRPLTRRVTATLRRGEVWESGLLPLAVEAAQPLVEGDVRPLVYFGAVLPREARTDVERGLSQTLRPGDPLSPREMPGEARLALDRRIQSDTDLQSETYAEYAAAGKGNGRRLVPVVMRDAQGKAGEVAAFLLPASRSEPLRAEYAGGYLQGGRFRAFGEPGLFVAEVVR